MDKTLNYLAIAQKAGLLVTGEENTGTAARAGKAKVLLLASDASENAKSRAMGFLFGKKAPMVVLPHTKDDIAGATGKTGCSMAAVTDIGLASSILSALAEDNSDAYSAIAAELAAKKEKAAQRKSEARAHDRNKKTGRRKKA